MKLRSTLAALGSLLTLLLAPAHAQETGYHRTYVIQADAAWIDAETRLAPAFVQISNGKIDWISQQDQRVESKNMFGKSMGKAKLIRVHGTLAAGMVDAWTKFSPAGYGADRKAGPTREVADSLPVQAPQEDVVLQAQVLAAREAGIAAVYIPGGMRGLRQGVGVAAEFTALDLPLDSGQHALDFAVGSAATPGIERVFQAEELRNAFVEAQDWRDSWDDFDEAMAKYEKDLAKYQEKLDKFVQEQKKKEQEGEAMAEDKDDAAKKPQPPKRPRRPAEPQSNAARDLLLKALDGAMPVRVVANRLADIRAMMALKEEFQLDLILLGAYEADYVAKDLAAAEIPVILPLVPDHHAQPEPKRSFARRYLALRKAKVEVAIASGGVEGMEFMLPIRAGEILAAGGEEGDVWASLTSVPAKLLGLKQYGALTAGKSATMILFEGRSPFDASAPFKAHKPK